MKDKVLEILGMPKNEESMSMLCELCGIKKFQANTIMDEYAKLKSTEEAMLEKGMDPVAFAGQKQIIIKGLTSGEYSKRERVASDLRNLVINLLHSEKTEENVKYLAETCNIDINIASQMIDNYKIIENNEKQLMTTGQDATNWTSRKMAIIEELSKTN